MTSFNASRQANNRFQLELEPHKKRGKNHLLKSCRAVTTEIHYYISGRWAGPSLLYIVEKDFAKLPHFYVNNLKHTKFSLNFKLLFLEKHDLINMKAYDLWPKYDIYKMLNEYRETFSVFSHLGLDLKDFLCQSIQWCRLSFLDKLKKFYDKISHCAMPCSTSIAALTGHVACPNSDSACRRSLSAWWWHQYLLRSSVPFRPSVIVPHSLSRLADGRSSSFGGIAIDDDRLHYGITLQI